MTSVTYPVKAVHVAYKSTRRSPRKDGLKRKVNGKANPEYQKALRTRRMYWLNKIKVYMGCGICGYNSHAVALEFDHLDRFSKRFTVSARNVTRSLSSIFEELRKCRVLCANCHRVHTYESKHFNNISGTGGSCGI
jgi:hypothetical protein